MDSKQVKRTKIVCTMGPAVDNESTLRSLIEEGMDIARLNLNHGSHEAHLARINRLKKLRRETGIPVAILMDMRGPGVRTGSLEGGKPIRLQAGKQIALTEMDVAGTQRLIHQSCPDLASRVAPGDAILIDDGLIELAVDEVVEGDIICTVQNTGLLGEHKTVNLPGTSLDLPIMTSQDHDDLVFGIENGVDFVSVPYVRSVDDIYEVRGFLNAHGGAGIGVIAKIERPEALDAIEPVIAASDGIVIARGDLGVEMDTAQVPHVQKRIVTLCNKMRTPVIVSSQMLDSMVREPRPTRAEVADVANAVYDGADALMLSGETALGKYPVPALRMMVKIAASSEAYVASPAAVADLGEGVQAVSPSVGLAAVSTAANVGAKCIVTPTTSGRTARLISNLRPQVPIYAVTHDEAIVRRMQLYWGVVPMLGGAEEAPMRETIEAAQKAVLDGGYVSGGDLAVFTAGDPSTGPALPGASDAASGHAGTSVMYVVQIHS